MHQRVKEVAPDQEGRETAEGLEAGGGVEMRYPVGRAGTTRRPLWSRSDPLLLIGIDNTREVFIFRFFEFVHVCMLDTLCGYP